jgi:hypothetical protein
MKREDSDTLTRLQERIMRKLAEAHPEWVTFSRSLSISAQELAASPEPLVASQPVHRFILGQAFRLTERGIRWCAANGCWPCGSPEARRAYPPSTRGNPCDR